MATRNLTPEEWTSLKKDIDEVFEKHGVDISIVSELTFVKKEDGIQEAKAN